ncbi:MAG: lipoate--protein ligase family protein [Candidatus Hydrogenedentes bacterium]|nr:lipoate--protein ligase family protein [Candidatus Hydrogenedentota bacterium]
MRIIDHSCKSPGENLALEEVLLDAVEQGHQPDTLRFWESPSPFVVLGTGQVLAQEVHEDHCTEDGVPIMRRCTAGGCVLQGPGSLNYALFLRYENVPEVATLHGSYRHIIGAVCAALGTLGISAAHEGISDIAIAGRKISGNAQRRRRRALLHHGTLLYQADMNAMSRYLREPDDRPEYRATRRHDEFLTVLDATPDALRDALGDALAPKGFQDTCTEEELRATHQLASEKYDRREWIYRR